MLKASVEVLQQNNGTFLLREFGKEAFDAPYHYHPEYELTYISVGVGKRYVGSHMSYFKKGDLVLLGPNLPHCWKLDTGGSGNEGARAIVLQFTMNSISTDFMEKIELSGIKRLLAKASYGISFQGRLNNVVKKHLSTLKTTNGLRGIITFLEILDQLSSTQDFTILALGDSVRNVASNDHHRINQVMAYIVENFRKQLSLQEASSIAHMTPNAFCKYFKKTTRKTFIETVIDYRLNYATNQLVQTEKAISEIAFESGFSDVSHFYRQFKHRMQVSPLNYRTKFVEQISHVT